MWPMNSRGRYPSVDLEQLVEGSEQAVVVNPTVQSRSVFAEAPPSKQPEGGPDDELPEDLSEVVRSGSNFSRLLKHRPDDIIPILRDHAVTKIGDFNSNDPELLKAFQKKNMVTFAFDERRIPECEATWKSILRHEGRKHLPDDGWHETMTIAIYCVNIKHAADVLGNGILRPLLLKAETGEADDAVWDFPSVRAVIDFKWTHWARRYLVAEFILYLSWLLCFVGFMTIYIEKNLDKGFLHDMNGGDKTFALIAYALDAGSLLFMCPFLAIEYNTIKYYKWKWLNMWNALDSLAYVLQFLVSALHFTHAAFHSSFYVSLLAAHCTLLFIKVQYFARVMGPRASYVETLKTLIYNVRYFLLFIVLSMISAALSLAVLYKWEIDRNEGKVGFNEDLVVFRSLPRSVVTAYSILLGSFESSYIFDTQNRFIKGVFFLLFQLFMSITLLNLLIAVMTETYGKSLTNENIAYNRSKAQLVDELELSLPEFLYPGFKCYVHFAVCEKRKRLRYELSTLVSQEATPSFEEEIRSELKELKTMIAEVRQAVLPQQSKSE